ncbi:MAG: hypothetical protein ACE5IF_01900 [Candidatus Bathyarchaeia archaeon]
MSHPIIHKVVNPHRHKAHNPGSLSEVLQQIIDLPADLSGLDVALPSTQAVRVSGETVDITVPTTIKTGSIRTITDNSGGDVLHSGAVKSVLLKAIPRSGNFYVGGSTNLNLPYSGYGFELASGEAIQIDCDNFEEIYVFATVSGDDVTFMGIN